jgi:hypothetical protein
MALERLKCYFRCLEFKVLSCGAMCYISVIHCESCLEIHSVPIIYATIVSILLTEKMLLCFKYFIEMK